MDRDITVRFYEIRQVDGGVVPLEAVIDRISRLPKLERERDVTGEIRLRLEHIEHRDGLLLGDLTRVQTENLPGHVTADENVRLPVERIGHPAAFCYDPQTRCLALQFDLKIGVGRVCNYFSQFLRDDSFGHMPILRPDALDQFERETPTKLTVKVARRQNFANADTRVTDFEEQIDAMGALFDAPTVEVSVSCRVTDGGLDKEGVLETVRRWLSYRDEINGITKITASTLESDEAFNFIKFLLKEQETLDLPANDPIDGRRMRLQFLRRKYLQYQGYLREIAGVI